MDVFEQALWISAVGMALVFAAILLLWGLMGALVRVFADRQPAERLAQTPPETRAAETADLLALRRKKAAAAAVAVALEQERFESGQNGAKARPKARPAVQADHPAAAGTPAQQWQAIHRASQISQRIQRPNRKGQR